MQSNVEKQLIHSNRLVIDVTLADYSAYDGLGHDAFTLAVQCLPVDVGETLRVDFIIPKIGTTKWLVTRVSATEYHFLWPQVNLGGRSLIGGVNIKPGWLNPPRPYEWMGQEVAGSLQAMLVWFFDEVEKRRLYPFVSNPHKDPKAVKNPSKRQKLEEQLNVIVYLGRPPGPPSKQPKTAKTESGDKDFGYPRRQHRRTLRAERFKNHPKYGVYKGVLVSQSWCGAKDYKDTRKTYRLWEPPEIDTTGTQ